MASIKEISKKINKAWKEDVLTSGNFVKEIKRVDVGDLGMTYPLYGGIPYGQLISFSGVEHSGKTTAACLVMARYQRENPDKVCIYVDAENTLLTQSDFIQRMTGLNFEPEHFMRYDMTGKSAEEMFADVLQLQEADDIGMIIIDSAPALISQADLDNEFGKDNGQRASIAKSLGKFIKQMIMYLPKRNNILLIINQVRIEQGFMGSIIYKEPCGYALNYYPSQKIRFGSRTFTLGDKTDISASKGEGADGFRLKFSLVKNRLGAMNRGGGFLTFRLDSGLDSIGDMLEIALKFGYIQRPTTQSYVLINLETGEVYQDSETGEDLKFVGKAKLMDYLHSHKEFLNNYSQMLNKYISEASTKVDLLDEKDMKEILDQEKALNAEIANNDEEDENEDK